MLIIDTDGSLLGMDESWLELSPFSNYLVPGIILFTALGIFPAVTAYGLIFKPHWLWTDTINIFKDKHWSWSFSIYSGIILIIWIIIQQLLTQYYWLQSVMLFTGIMIIIISLTPAVMNYCSVHNMVSDDKA